MMIIQLYVLITVEIMKISFMNIMENVLIIVIMELMILLPLKNVNVN